MHAITGLMSKNVKPAHIEVSSYSCLYTSIVLQQYPILNIIPKFLTFKIKIILKVGRDDVLLHDDSNAIH